MQIKMCILPAALLALAAAGGPATAATIAALSWGECTYSVPGEAMRCGTLNVPEDYDKPEGRRVDLPLAILSATSGDAAADPIFYLNGGPGASAIGWLSTISRIGAPRADRDLVVLEQRGNGSASPSLVCGDEETRACHDRLARVGIDLSQYGSTNAAHDVEQLRLALGAPRVNLYGISYGTTLAMQVMRLHPDGVRSAVLDSPTAPDADIAIADVTSQLDGLSRIFAACRDDTDCAGAFPNLRARFVAAVARLDADPQDVGAEPLQALLGPELTGAALVRTAAQQCRTPSFSDAFPR